MKKRRTTMGQGFISKLKSRFLWLNLAAMAVVVVLLLVGVIRGLSSYTHHGEGIEVPDLSGKDFADAQSLLAGQRLYVVANDTGYNKRMEAGCILTQTPGAGTMVKEGRTIYVTINSNSSPLVVIPDVIDNSSYREAQARLTAIGFRLLDPQVIDGERDWVYGIKSGEKNLQSGDRVPVETPLTLVIGNGTSIADEEQEDAMLDMPLTGGDDFDDFEEIGN